MIKSLVTGVLALFFLSESALANTIINLNTSKSKVLFRTLKAVGAPQKGPHIDLSGIYCVVRYERQSGDPGQKAEVLAISNCSFDSDNNFGPLTSAQSDKLIGALAVAGVRLGKATKTEGGISERSLFVQSISCSKYVEAGQDKYHRQVAVDVHICSVEI